MTSANFNINGFGDVKLTPYSPLLGYKAWDSFIGSIQSLSDLIYNVDNNRNKMEITVNNAIQAADSFLSSIGRDNKITNTASLLASLDNIFLNLRNVSRDIRETGKFKPNDIQQAIGDIFIAAGDGLQYIKQQTEAMAQSKFLPTKLKTGLNDVLNSRMLKSSTVLQHELNYLGFKIKDYGNERLGESIMNIDDFTPSKIANFFADPDTYSNVLEEVSRFIYSLVPDDANPWKGGEDYIGRGISEWGELLEKWYKQDFLPYLEKEWDQFPKFEDWLPEFPEWAREWLKLDPKRSGKYHVYDPLALDLDGDGIETVAAKGFAGALFDHRNQGIRTATDWVSADDGLLVRDLNGNGIIDNGAELFGDNTKLADGSFAKHGYAALAELDSNGDNIINAADAAFQTLRVWQDLNQDGISQANELRTLEELGIQSLDLAYKDVNKNLGNGNTLAQQGSYTKTDGTTAKMGDLLLAADNLHSRFKDKVELTAEQAKAANLAGIGRLRDLREAAALSGDLANMLKAYSAAETKEAQLALLDNLIHKWAETDSNWGKKSPMRLSTDWTQTANEGIALTPSQVAQLKKNALVSLSDKAKAAIDAARDRIAVLDAYTGQDSSTLYYMSEEDALNIVKVTNDTYDHLAKNIYQNLLFQTRLQPYLNQISFKMENDTFTLDFSGLVQAFNHVKETNPQKAFVDLAEMLAYGELRSWYEGRRLMADYVEEAKKAGKFEDYQKVLGQETVALLAKTSGTQADDILQNVGFGHNKNVSLYGNDGNDTLIGGA
ncbi:calcium-binding protein, partial [Neisseria meningitidis]|uniref:calcium-binding protein n=1 Tax=Neisseria meningitidis TaxID=487 RepID=UPI001C5BBC0F